MKKAWGAGRLGASPDRKQKAGHAKASAGEGKTRSRGNQKSFIEAHCFALLAILVIGSFAVQLSLLQAGGYVSGDDGGYYAYHTRNLLEGKWDGSLTEPSPVFFCTAAAFAMLFGTFAGVNIATALFSSLIGASIFVLAQYLFKNKAVSLMAALFFLASGFSILMCSDWKKSVAGAFFVPLLLYFLFKSFEDRRHVLPLFIIGGLAALSHKTAAVAGFVAVSYFVLYLALKRKLPLKELKVFLLLCAAGLIAALVLFPGLADNLSWIAKQSGMFRDMTSESLYFFIAPLVAFSVVGAGICLRQKSREDIILLAWALTLFVMSLPQVSGPATYRFMYLMAMPLSIMGALSLYWAHKRWGPPAILAALALVAVLAMQFAGYGMYSNEMTPVPNKAALDSISELASRLPDGAAVYSTLYRSCEPNAWINGYFFYRDTRPINCNSIYDYINKDFLSGREVYIIQPDICTISADIPCNLGHLSDPGLKAVYNKSNVLAFKLEWVVRLQGSFESGGYEVGAYDAGRLDYASSYLILPYELMFAWGPPYVIIFQGVFGIPASIFLIGLAMSIAERRASGMKRKRLYCIAIAITGVITLIYILHPAFFWGPKL